MSGLTFEVAGVRIPAVLRSFVFGSRRGAVAFAVAFSVMCATGAETVNDWENPAVNSINRLPARSYSMPLADEQAAFTDAIEPETPWKISLNGKWRISWTGDPRLRVRDFWKPGYDDSDWFEIDVPSCVELKGFGSPGYTNSQYPHARKWPRILDVDTLEPDYNPVTGYRRTFRIPDGWKDRNVILRFDGVYSAYYVWVNGRKVGYAEDSKLPSEFDITPFLNASGDQTLCVEVYRWCDGSYLEDQDMIRYSGIFRDVTVWSRPADGIWDFTVKTELSDGYRAATVSLEGLEGAWSAVLYDAARNPVARLSPSAVSARLESVRLWSAEDPYLYTLIVKKGDDIRMRRVGFKEQRISGNTLLVNGRKIKFKGVNRHECSVENGRTVSLDEMIQDITLMKRYNIDTVRTSHYPNHRLWYDLCDRYGIYLIAEANVEAHGYGYKEEGLGDIPAWNHSIVERNVRHAVFYRNHPSVTMWSMGNESGHGDCFRNAIAAVKKTDPSRPVHWERGNADADIDSSMYPSVEWLEKRGKLGNVSSGDLSGEEGGGGYAISGHTAGKPYIACEYAHAMGNAIGNFREYWDVMYSYDCLLGGCIWDWVDQSVWMGTGHIDPATGREERFLAYGGDWDEEPHLGPFCNNGVTDPFRNVTAKLVEVAHVHRNLVVTRKDDGFLELWNRHGFTRADVFDGSWELVEDGTAVASGNFAVPPVAPLSRGKLDLPLPAYGFREGCEYFLNVSFKTKRDALWAKKGWTVARDQIPVCGTPAWVRFSGKTDPQGVSVDASGDCVTVSAGPTKAVFSRKTGTLSELTMGGRTILKDPAESVVSGPLLTCARAFTDNDRWVRDGSPWGENRKIGGFFSRGLSRLRHHARPLAVNGATVTARMAVTGSKSAGFIHEAVWSFSSDGSVVVSNTVIPHGTMPPALPRLGLSMRLDAGLGLMAYYGRGPRENYIDRNSGSFVGLWRSTVADQYEPYVRPQENGGKSDVRWVEFTDESGKGVRFTASEPLFVKASHHDWEDLDFARHRAGQKRYRSLPPVRKEIYLDLDIRQLGLGGASCGPKPMEKYTFPIRKEAWTLRFEPARRSKD